MLILERVDVQFISCRGLNGVVQAAVAEGAVIEYNSDIAMIAVGTLAHLYLRYYPTFPIRVEGEKAIVEETTEETGAEGEPAEPEAAGSEAAPAEGEVTSTTVLEAGAIYTVENDMPLYAEASTGSEQLLTLLAGYQVAVLEPAEASNGWHNVRVWLGGGTTDGYIQIP